MSKISFEAFCVEYYASHAGIAGAEAYRRFDDGDATILFFENRYGAGRRCNGTVRAIGVEYRRRVYG